MKSYTNLEQSRKLAEFLPVESADMRYAPFGDTHPRFWDGHLLEKGAIPCWSLAALLSVLPKEIEIDEQYYAPCLFPVQDKWLLKLWYNSNYIFTSPIAIFSDNPLDACVEMIIKMHKQKIL